LCCCDEDFDAQPSERAPFVSAPPQRSMDEAGGRAAPAPWMEGAASPRYEAPPARGADAGPLFSESTSAGAPSAFRGAAGDADAYAAAPLRPAAGEGANEAARGGGDWVAF